MSNRDQRNSITILLLYMIVNTLCECSSNQVALVVNLPNDRFSASVPSNINMPPWEAKMSSGDAWCSTEITDITVSPYLQVNFTMPVEISSITIGGHDNFFLFDDYITNYQVRYRPVGSATIQFVVDGDGNPLIIPRASIINAQEYTLPSPIITEDVLQIKVPPGSWNTDRVCITLEAHGCPADINSTSTIMSAQELVSSPYTAPDMIQSSLPITTVSYTHMISSSTLPRDRRATTSVSPQSIFTPLKEYERCYTSISRQIITSSVRIASGSGAERSNHDAVVAGASAGVVVVVVIILVIVGLLSVCMFIVVKRSKPQRSSTVAELDNIPSGEDNGKLIEKKKELEHETGIVNNEHHKSHDCSATENSTECLYSAPENSDQFAAQSESNILPGNNTVDCTTNYTTLNPAYNIVARTYIEGRRGMNTEINTPLYSSITT